MAGKLVPCEMLFVRLVANVALLDTVITSTEARVPVVPELPSWSVPAVTLTVPESRLLLVKARVPRPLLVRLPFVPPLTPTSPLSTASTSADPLSTSTVRDPPERLRALVNVIVESAAVLPSTSGLVLTNDPVPLHEIVLPPSVTERLPPEAAKPPPPVSNCT